MEKHSLKAIVESILFATDKPLNAGEILKVIQRAEGSQVAEKSEDKAEVKAPEKIELSAEVTLETIPEELSENQESSPLLSLVQDVEAIAMEAEVPASEMDALAQLTQLQQNEEEKITRSDVQRVIDELVADFQLNPDRGFVLINVAHGFQFRTRPELSSYVKAMSKVSATKLSQSALETLAMVAYRQPITRAEIEDIRGVDSGGVLKTLMDRDLVKIVGKKEEAGKPLLYGSTETFLESFNLRGLQDLPTLKDLRQIEDDLRREAQAASGESVEVSDGFFDENPAEPIRPFSEQSQDLEREEAEAFAELDEQLKSLENVEKQVVEIFQQATQSPEEINPEPKS